MNIIEATKEAMLKGAGITRPAFKNAVYLIPTNTNECYISVPVGFKLEHKKSDSISAAPRWNPHAADILADDWELTEAAL
ncbi:MAG: DUF2829 domain-containing protein [Candidatus Ornithomonoglobus sp.]